MTQRPRQCLTCGPVAWRKVKPAGARASRFECVTCGRPTHRIKRGRGKAQKSDRRKAIEALDATWSQVVRLTSRGLCECGCGRMGHAAHHIFGKKACPRTRFETNNGAWLTDGCHARMHRDHEANRSLGIKLMGGQRAYENMNLLAHTRGAKLDLALVRLDLDAQLRAVEAA